MRRTLILGAGGMLGYAVGAWFAWRGYQVAGTIHRQAWAGRFPAPCSLLFGVDALRFQTVIRALDEFQPDLAINCIAVRSADDCSRLIEMFRVNGQFPQRFAAACAARGIHLIHISTDGVFDGREGNYDEQSPTSPIDPYGRSKSFGEQPGAQALTLRTSMIGRAPSGSGTLLDWLMASRGKVVHGYSMVRFSGMPVTEIARYLDTLISSGRPLPSGILHLPGHELDKFALLRLLRRELRDSAPVLEDRSRAANRSLTSSRPDAFAGFEPSPWPDAIESMFRFYRAFGVPD